MSCQSLLPLTPPPNPTRTHPPLHLLQYHPDKNPDPKAAEYFAQYITKVRNSGRALSGRPFLMSSGPIRAGHQAPDPARLAGGKGEGACCMASCSRWDSKGWGHMAGLAAPW